MAKKNPALYRRILQILESARSSVARSVNTSQVVANWLIGGEIVEEEQSVLPASLREKSGLGCYDGCGGLSASMRSRRFGGAYNASAASIAFGRGVAECL
jgi:hypothetical protein